MAGPIKVEFEISKQKAKEGVITVNVVNNSEKVLKILAWNTALEKTISANIFQVKHEKKTMTYLGRMVKRGKPTEDDYITLQKHEIRKVEIDLAQYYDMQEAGKYSITYHGQFKLKNSNTQKNILYNANSTTYIYYNPAEKKILKIPAKTTNYNGCSTAERSIISDAHSAAINISLDAKNAMAQANPDIRQERYVIWFGEPNSGRQDTITTHFNNIYHDLSTENILYDCTCTESNWYAYVYAFFPYTIYLCGGFWLADTTGYNSKAGTIVHEMSHFWNVAGTYDYTYGYYPSQSLAESKPNNAIDNADNHQYFAENIPTLSMVDSIFDNAIVINDLVFDTPITETIVTSHDCDIYTFIAPKTDTYTFYTTSDLNTYGTLYNNTHDPIASNACIDCMIGNFNFSFTVNLTQGESYFLRVDGYDVGRYTLHVDYGNKFAFLIPVYHILLQ